MLQTLCGWHRLLLSPPVHVAQLHLCSSSAHNSSVVQSAAHRTESHWWCSPWLELWLCITPKCQWPSFCLAPQRRAAPSRVQCGYLWQQRVLLHLTDTHTQYGEGGWVSTCARMYGVEWDVARVGILSNCECNTFISERDCESECACV